MRNDIIVIPVFVPVERVITRKIWVPPSVPVSVAMAYLSNFGCPHFRKPEKAVQWLEQQTDPEFVNVRQRFAELVELESSRQPEPKPEPKPKQRNTSTGRTLTMWEKL